MWEKIKLKNIKVGDTVKHNSWEDKFVKIEFIRKFEESEHVAICGIDEDGDFTAQKLHFTNHCLGVETEEVETKLKDNGNFDPKEMLAKALGLPGSNSKSKGYFLKEIPDPKEPLLSDKVKSLISHISMGVEGVIPENHSKEIADWMTWANTMIEAQKELV